MRARRRPLACAALAGLLACSTNAGGPEPDGGSDCAIDPSAGERVFACNDMQVTLTVPDACAGGGCGVVLDVHGAFMGADGEDLVSHMRALGRSHGYVVVQPTAPTNTVSGPSWLMRDDDGVFDVLQRVVAATRADPKRLHVMGFSQGGFMTWRMLCAHADVLASVAPGGAGSNGCAQGVPMASCPFDATGTPSQAIDVLMMAGRKDPLVPLTCTEQQRDLVVHAWGMGAPQPVASDSVYTRTRYASGAGVVLESIEHDYVTDPASALAVNLGHCVPTKALDASGAYWDALQCKQPNAFTWGDEVVAFFEAHPRR